MKTKFDEKGVTLIELLIALVISGIIVAAIYRMFVAQTRSYTVQDQVAEVQQNVRNAMELLVRDIRMAGFDDDKLNSLGEDIHPPAAIINAAANSIMVSYEYNVARRDVTYSLDASDPNNIKLVRTQDQNGVVDRDEILDNVNVNGNGFHLTYFIDMIDPLTGKSDRRSHFEVEAGAIGVANVVAVRVRLSATPASNNPDVNAQVSPRRLDTVVTLRNQLSEKKVSY